jgi:hypothetical protein
MIQEEGNSVTRKMKELVVIGTAELVISQQSLDKVFTWLPLLQDKKQLHL